MALGSKALSIAIWRGETDGSILLIRTAEACLLTAVLISPAFRFMMRRQDIKQWRRLAADHSWNPVRYRWLRAPATNLHGALSSDSVEWDRQATTASASRVTLPHRRAGSSSAPGPIPVAVLRLAGHRQSRFPPRRRTVAPLEMDVVAHFLEDIDRAAGAGVAVGVGEEVVVEGAQEGRGFARPGAVGGLSAGVRAIGGRATAPGRLEPVTAALALAASPGRHFVTLFVTVTQSVTKYALVAARARASGSGPARPSLGAPGQIA